MSQVCGVLNVTGDQLMFWCPGCDDAHAVSSAWTFNGDYERPTFQPSVLMSADYWEPPVTPENFEQWKRESWEQHAVRRVCHSFVTDGHIQFLGDCTHALANQTVDIPAWPLALRMRKHLGRYAKGGGPFSGKPYRHCLECGRWLRNPGNKPVLRNGRKPR